MSDKLAIQKQELPTLQELVKDVGLYVEQDKLNFLLNQEPPKTWIKEHPFIRGHKYLPIDKIEYLMRKVFKEYKIEVLREGTSFNGVFVVVRVHYKNLASNEWSYHDGIGAINMQLRKQTREEKENNIKVDFNTININNGALSMAFPLAKTLAIKDACDMFGTLFGANLNRRDTLPASMDKVILTNTEKETEIGRILNDNELTEDDRMYLERVLEEKDTLSYDKVIKAFK